MSPATEASSAENTTRGPRPGVHASTICVATESGIGVARRQGATAPYGLPFRSLARREPGRTEPGMSCETRDELLTDHPGGAQHAYIEGAHVVILR